MSSVYIVINTNVLKYACIGDFFVLQKRDCVHFYKQYKIFRNEFKINSYFILDIVQYIIIHFCNFAPAEILYYVFLCIFSE